MIKFKTIDNKGKVTLAAVYLTLFVTYPYVFSRFFSLPDLTIFVVLEVFVLAMVCFTIKKTKSLPKPFQTICLIQVAVFLLLFLYHYDFFYLSRFALFVIIAYFSLYAIYNTLGLNKFVSINNAWLAIQAVLGVIGFFLIMGNLIQPLLVVDFSEYGHDYFYGITTTNSFAGVIPRIAGFFDEPGALAQWGVYALVLNKISPFYNKKTEWILIIGLIVTFSMAYYIQLTIYFVLFNYNRFRKIVPIVIGLIVLLVIAQRYISSDSDLYYLTLRRFETTGGQLETNRDMSSEVAKKYFKEDPLMGQGYTELVEKGTYFFDNPYETLATSGIIGTIALYLPLLVILFKYRKHGAWQAVLVLAVGYLQRPFHIQYIHYLMMYLLFLMCYYNNKSKQIGLKLE